MKRLNRFVLPALARAKKPNFRRLSVLSMSGLALLGMVIVGNVFAPPVQAVTIRSSSGSDACTVEVGNASNASVALNNGYCVVTVTNSTSVTFPSYVNTIGIVAVGGGGGGGTDGGAGGSGGETRYSASQGVTAGGTATVTIGAGGAGSVWSGASGGNGSPTSVSGAGLNYTANGGYLGGGWNSCSIRYGSTGGSGGTGGTSATGGTGGNGTLNGCPNAGGFSYGGVGGNGPYISTISGISASYYAGGGGGGTCLGVGTTYSVTGAAGGAAGGGRGTSYTPNVGATAGSAATPNTGGGGGAGAACDWSDSNYNGSTERTPGGAGGSGVAMFSFLANKLAFNQVPDGCLTTVAEGCIQPAKVQLQGSNGGNLSTSGLTVTLVSASAGTLGGTLTGSTDASGIATFSNFWITGLSLGNTTTLTFEIPGWRNVQTTITMKGYAENLTVVSGSTDTAGSFFGSTGTWLASASSSSISVTSLQNELAVRNVKLRAAAATASTTLGTVNFAANAVMTSAASTARTMTVVASRNVLFDSTARLTTSGQPLNLVFNTDSDGLNGGVFLLPGNATNYQIDTNGGAVAVGGGTANITWNGLSIPAYYSAGYKPFTGSWWGVELGTNTDTANLKLIRTSNGQLRLYGYAWADAGASALYGIAWESGAIDTGSGEIELNGATNGSPSTATNDNWGVGFGANHGTGNDVPKLISSATASVTGSVTTPGTSNYWAVAMGFADITTGPGGFNVTTTQRSTAWNANIFRSPVTFTSGETWLSGTNGFRDDVTFVSTAGDLKIGGTQTVVGAAAPVTLKSSANITLEPNAAIAADANDILIWSDSDGDTSRGGGIKTGAGSSITTDGGSVTLSGGRTYSSSWSKGTTTTSDVGIYLSGSISAGSGAITIRGEEGASPASNAQGVLIDKGAELRTTSGAITIEGKVDAASTNTTNGHTAIYIGNNDATNPARVTTDSGAINILGDASGNSNDRRRGLVMYKSSITSTSGSVTLDARSNTLTNSFDFYILSGDNTVSSTSGAVLLKGSAGSYSALETATISSGVSVTLQMSRFGVGTGATFTLAGASPKVIESTTSENSFGASTDLARMVVSSNSTSVRVGKTTNGSAVTLGTAWTTAGPVSVYGGTVAVNGNITVTGSGNAFLAKAMGDITTGNSVTVQTNGGNIVFWPNSDKVAAVANNTGRFASGTNLTLRSQGGQIRIAGGLDDGGGDATITSAKGAWSSMAAGDGLPDGYGVGNSTSGQSAGVLLSSGYTLSSAGGDIFIAGMDAPTTSDASRTVQLVDGLIDSGTGRIALWAKAYANATLNEGMVLHTTNNTAGSIITSANRTAQAITLYSDTSPNTNGSSDGINVYGHGTNTTAFGWQALALIATGAKDANDLVNFPGGGIAVTGIASGTASNGGHGIVWQWADALAKDGPITFTGQNNESTGGYSGAGMYIGDSNYSTANHWGAWHTNFVYTNLAGTVTDFLTSSSDITLNANKFVFYEPSSIGPSSGYWFNTSGDVTIQSVGSTFTSDQGYSHWQFNNIKVTGNPRNFTVGKPTDTSYFLWWADLSVTGEIKFHGRHLFIVAGTDLKTTQAASGTATRNTGVLIKTTEKSYFQGTNVLQTGGADITIWQDRDNDGVGALYAETGLQLKSNGGNITIAGGLDDGAANFSEITGRTANDGAPDNYSAGFSGWGANGGVDITGGTYQILSGGGDIFIAGRGSAAAGDDDYGVLLRGGLMYSDAGKISIYGKAPASCAANWHRGIGLGWNGDGGVADNIISNSTAADAIKLSADMASCNSGGSVYANAIESYFSAGNYIATPNGGGITVYGQQGSASVTSGAWGNNLQESSILELNYTNIVSNSGPINITGARVSGSGNHSVRFNTRGTGQANSVGALSATRSTGFTAYPTIDISASTSDVTVTGDSLVLYSTTFRNTGDLVLQPYAASFDRDQYLSSDWAAYFPATYESVRIGKAGTNGSNQSSANLFVDRFASRGEISIYGGNVTLKDGLTTSATSGTGILVKATNNITFTGGSSGANKTVQVTGANSTAPINIWANADASGEGYIYANNYIDFTTQGGAINMGGSSVAADTSPGSYAVSNTASRAGVHLGTSNGTSNANVRITSNGGNINIRGKATPANTWGILGYGGFNVNSGAGRIVMDGYSTSGQGIDLEGTSSNLGTITSAAEANATPAISMIGKSDTTGSGADRGLWITYGIKISATGGGDVSLTGDNAAVPSTNVGSIYIYGSDIVATTGKVTLDGGTDGVVTSVSGYTSNLGAISAGSAAGAVSIIGDRITSAGTTNIKTTGAVVAEPKSATFTAFSLSGTTINAVATSIRLAKETDRTSAMTVGGSLAASGPISIYGGNIALNAGLSVTPSTTGSILVKGGGDIITAASLSFSTSGGNVTFWSDADASGSGRIGLDATNSITTSGGKITLAGGADDGGSTVTSGRGNDDGFPDGFAAGNGSTASCNAVTATLVGVFLGTTTTLNSSNGAIFIAGKGLTGATGNCVSGIISNADVWIKAGSGKIGMYGISNPGSASTYAAGIVFGGDSARDTIISSSNSAADSIVISGNSGPTASGRQYGVLFNAASAGTNINNIVANTGTGGIQITGRSVSTNSTLTDGVGDGIEIYATAVLAKSGPIVLTGTTGSSNSGENVGCSIDHSTLTRISPSQASFGARANTVVDTVDMSASTSNVTLNCDSFMIGNSTQAKSVLTLGTVTLQPADGAQSFDRSISTSGLTLGSTVTGFTVGQSGTGGTVSGLTQNAQDVTLSGTTSIAGPISVFGASITVSENLVTTSGAITLKGTEQVVVGMGTNATTRRLVQTSGGAINLWSNADAAGTGPLVIGSFVTLSSGGGAIRLAGSASATEPSPTGFAVANSTYAAGVQLGTAAATSNLTINSSGGDILIQGTSAQNVSNSMGVIQYAGSTIDSGLGAIKIDGRSTASSGTFNRHGIELGFDGTASTLITSAKASGDAIVINGQTSGTSTDGKGLNFWSGAAGTYVKVSATGTAGNVKLSGSATSASMAGVSINWARILSAGGTVTIDSGTNPTTFGASSTSSAVHVGADTAGGASGDIEMNAGSFSFAGTNNFRTAGSLSFDSGAAQSFTAAQTFAAANVTVNEVKNFRVGTAGTGDAQNIANVTISSPVAATGAIAIYGGDIAANGNLTTSTASELLLKGAGDIAVGAGVSGARRTLSTVNGPITIWSNSDAGSFGDIQIGNYSDLSSGAGAITLAGGSTATESSPTGYASARTGGYGVALGTSSVATDVVKLKTTSGDIVIRGKIHQTNALGVGINLWSGSNVTSDTGVITIDGQSYLPTGTTQGHATYLNFMGGYTTTITSGATSKTAISISGTVTSGAGSSTNAYGVISYASTGAANIRATGAGGDISISGVAATNTTDALAFNATNISATSGDISMNAGTQRVAFGQVAANTFGGAVSAANHTGDLTICAGNVAFSSASTQTIRTVGALVIEPCSGSFTDPQSWSSADVTVAAGSARFGRTGNTANIAVSTPLTLTGDLEIIGGAITYNGVGVTSTGATSDVIITASGAFTGPAAFNVGGNITVASAAFSGSGALTAGGNVQITSTTFDGTGAITSAGADGISVTTTAGDLDTGANITANTVATAPIVLKSTGNILLGNNLASAGGPITLWSDTDALNAGGIYTASGTLVTSNGGDVTLSGGTDLTTGFAKATTANNNGLDGAYSGIRVLGKINAGAGNVLLRGKDNATIGNTSHNAGIQFDKSFAITTTTGDVTILGMLDNAAVGTGNHHGVLMGYGGTSSTGTNAITTVDGDISITGDASPLNISTATGLRPETVTISSTTGDITLEGKGSAVGAYDIDWNGASVTSTSGNVLVATGTTNGLIDFGGTNPQISSDSTVIVQAYKPTFTLLSLSGTGTKTIEPPTGATSFGAAVSTANLTIASTSTALTIGSSTNTASIALGKATSISGPITVYGGAVTNSANLTATTANGTIDINSNGLFTNSAAISSAAGNQPTTIKAEKAALGGSINSGTAATQMTGFASGRTIDLGLAGDTTNTLAVTDAELDTITAGTIRVGDSTSGNITVSASISIASAKSTTLALRTAGNVTAGNNVTVSATNLGVSAGGTVSLPGNNGVSGNLALVAAGATTAAGASFGSSGTYTAAAVDGITPIFGIGKNITISSAPAVGATEVRYLNQTWSAPPVVTVKDEYGIVISANNLNKTTYTTTVSGSGAPTIAGATPVLNGGTQTFSSLNFTTATGSTDLTFTTAGLAAGGTSTVTTGTYDVQGGEPTSIVITKTSASAPARKTGFGLVATLKDQGNNTVSGTHSTASVSVAVAEVTSDGDASNNPTIFSGGTVSTIGGVADFSSLTLSGKVLTSYRLTFTVTFTDSGNVSRTITTSEDVTVTHGDAHHLSLAVAPSLVNDTEFATQPVVRIYDADNNLVTTGAQSNQLVTLTATGADIGGTSSMNANQGVANFINKGVKLTGLRGAKALKAEISSPSLISQSETVTISFGAPHHLMRTRDAASASNGAAFGTQPVVEIRDISENLVENSTLTVTASVSPNGTLTGDFQVDAVSGVATFTDLGLTATAGTKTLTFEAANISSASQPILAVTGAPTQLRIDVASTLVNNTAFATQPVVTLLDSTGNVVSVGAYSTQDVTLSSPDAAISGTLVMRSVAGVADFVGKGIKLTELEGLRHLKASISSPNPVEELAEVEITFGAATQLSIASGASDIAANRIAFDNQPAIKVLDVSGNLVADSIATIDVTVTGANGAVLGGDTSMAAVGGIAYFNNNTNKLKLSGRIGDYTLYYDSTGLTGDDEDVELRHGTATQIVLTEDAAGAKSGQAFTTQPTLEVRDADNNLVDTGAAASAEIKVTTTAAAYNAGAHTGANLTGPANSDVETASGGVATFAGLRLEGVVASAYNLTFTVQNTAGYNGFDETQNIELTAGTETKLRVVEQPSDIVAGVAFATAVEAEILDFWNNRVLDVASSVSIKPTMFADALATDSVDSSKLAVSNTSGLVTFTGLTFTKAGTHYIQFTSDGLTAVTSSAFNITNAEADHLTWITTPVGAKNDYAIKGAANADPELEVRDEFENPVLVGSATSVTVTEQTSTADVLAISGATASSDAYARVKFSNLVMRAKEGDYDLDFTATNGNLTVTGESDAVTITFGDPYALNLTRSASGATSDAPFAVQPTLNIEDSAGNIVADSTLSVSVTTDVEQVLGGTTSLPAVAGQVDFTGSGMMLSGDVATGLTLKYAITINGNEIFTTQEIDLDPGLAIDLTIDQQPTEVRTRDAFSPVPTVILRDASGNAVTTDSSSSVSAQLMKADGIMLGTPTAGVVAANGVVTFTGLSFTAPATTGYRVTFTLLSNNQDVTSNTFTILPGAATELRIVQAPATVEADQSRTMTGEVMPTQPIVELRDFDGNLVTTTNSGQATIRVKSGVGGDLTEGSTTANFVGGIAEFSGVKLVGTPGVDYVLEFTNANPALTSPATSPIRVAHNVAHHIALTTEAADGKSEDIFTTQPVVKVLDRYNNVVTSGPGSNDSVRVDAAITAQNGTPLSTPIEIDAFASSKRTNQGVANFTSLGITGLVTNTYSLTYTLDLAGIASVAQTGVTIAHGELDHLTVVTQPVGGNATGDVLATQPVIELRDSAENVVTTIGQQSVAATISSTAGLVLLDNSVANPSVARLENATMLSNNGVVTFDQLKLFGLPGTGYTIKFSINSLFTASAPVFVTHAAAHHLTITQQPTGGNATGQNLAGQPTVELRDLYENVVTSNSTDVLTARIATSSVVRLEGSTTATFSQGVATFAGLQVIALPGLDYNLDFTTTVGSTALTSAPTDNFRVTWSTPTQLAVVTQPSGGTTGVALNTQPVVEVRDYYGNRVFDFVGSITAAVGGSNSTLTSASSSTLQATVVDGRASFTDLALTATPAIDYQLTFSSGALTSINSDNIRVIPGAPVRLAILNEPIGAQTGAELAGQPVVHVLDSFGNRVTQDNSTVITATLSAGSGGTLTRVVSGSPTAIQATVVNGVATFSNLVMRGLTSQQYRLTFESGDLAAVNSANFNVLHAAVARLDWNTQPQVGMTGSPLTRAAVLELKDMDGNIATDDVTTVVTAVVTTGTGARPLQSATAIADHGVVTFTNLTLTGTPGTAYKLTFTGVIGGASFAAPESNALVLTHAVPAKVVMVGGNVNGGLTGELLTDQPVLEVRDRFDNLATSDDSTVVTSSIINAADQADSTGRIDEGATATAENGIVTFTGLKVSGTPGTDYTLNFAGNWNGTTLTGDTSNEFHVSKVADLTLSYDAQDFVLNAVVPAQFYTDSPAGYSFTTNASSLICVLDPDTGDLTIKGAGNCVVNVAIDEDSDGFYLANATSATLVINKAQQAPVTFTSPATVNYWSGLNPVATGGSGTGLYSFEVYRGDPVETVVNGVTTVTYENPSTCRLIGATIIPGDAGSLCRITATRAGDLNYLPRTSDVQVITVNKIQQAALAIASPETMSVDNLNLFTSGGSGSGAVTYRIVSAGTSRCSVTDAVLSAASSGTCKVRATKAASTNYESITSPDFTIRVTKEAQTVAFTSTAPMNPTIRGTYVPTAVATSGLAVTYSVATGSSCAVDTLIPGQINFTASGMCELVATQAGSARYAPAEARQFIQVGAYNQTIRFDVIPDLAFGTPAFKIAPTTNAGVDAPIVLSTTGNSTACTLAGNIVTLTSAGLCEISANQAGYGSFLAATEVVRSFKVVADLAGAPQIFSSSVATHSLTASFTAPSYNGGSAITGYVLIATDTAGNSYENAACGPVIAASINCTIVGIPNGVAYTAVARAITSAGRGIASNVTMSQTPNDAPMAVTEMTASITATGMEVTWTPPVTSGGRDDEGNLIISGYEVTVVPFGAEFSTGTKYMVPGASSDETIITNFNTAAVAEPTPEPTTAAANTRISFRRASVASSTSASHQSSAPVGASSSQSPAGYRIQVVTKFASPEQEVDGNITEGFQTDFAVPLPPSQLTLTPTGSDLVISWTAPTADGGKPVIGYEVWVAGVCEKDPADTNDPKIRCLRLSASDLFYVYEGMNPGVTYNVEVFAINEIGLSAASVSSHAVPALPAPPVEAPASPSATPTPTPTASPTATPSISPTPKPTVKPSVKPTDKPIAKPGAKPSVKPIAKPSPTSTSTAEPVVPVEPTDPGSPVLPEESEPFDPMGSPESIKAVTETTAKAAAIAAAMAAAAAAGAAAAGRSGGSSGSSGSSDPGSIATIDAAHEQYELRRRGRGDRLKVWRRRWMRLLDKISIRATLLTAPISPVLSRIVVDGAYLRAAAGIFASLPTIAAAAIAAAALAINGTTITTPIWQLFLAITLIGIFDAFAGMVGTAIFVIGAFAIHALAGLPIAMGDVRMMLGVIIVGFGPALLANSFRVFRKVPEKGSSYVWERIVDLGVLPFIGGWVTATMIATLPALAGMTLSVADHVNEFALAVAAAIVIRVVGEELVAREFSERLDTLHPTEVPATPGFQRWISLGFRLAVFIFVTAALMGNEWQAWVGSALFVLPTMLGWWQNRFPNSKWLWRIMPQGIPGLAFTLLVATITTNIVSSWFDGTPEAALWSFALLPIPMLALSILGLIGREGDEDEVRWIRQPRFVWVYRIGGIIMLVLTMKVAGVI